MRTNLYPQIRLNKRGVKKVLQGKLWLTPDDCSGSRNYLLEEIIPGSLVTLVSETGDFLAQAYCNPKAFYAIKILTRERELIDQTFFKRQIKKALDLRTKLFPDSRVFRLIHAEGDYLPGLIVDVYGDLVVIQCHTLGMERLLPSVEEALRSLLNPRFIFIKNDFERRKEEDLPLYTRAEPDSIPDPFEIEIDGLKFLIPLRQGQKTGFFLDQRVNRRFIGALCKDLIVIDGFCYVGAFGMYALKGGAKRVFLVDRSSRALDLALEIAQLNRFRDRVIPVEGDLFKVLKGLSDRADLLILDPPAFIKSREDKEQGLSKYRELIALGMGLFQRKEGFLSIFSCSHFLSLEELENLCRETLFKEGISGQLLKYFSQAEDHPINPFVEETKYLKGLFLRLLRA